MSTTIEDKIEAGHAVTDQRSLKVRHLTMMGLGSAIGAGLFVGSGKGIAVAGPGIIVSYIIAGLCVVLVMRMLGEMGSAIPHSSSFSYYASVGIGRPVGFVVGWIYWYVLVLVLGVELTAASQIIASWVNVPAWIPAICAVAVFSVINLINVSQFGEFEFWFAAIKVVVIIAFMIIGFLVVFGLLPGTHAVGFTNLVSHGGFFPQGFSGVSSGLLIVAFAFGGIELVTIAAAESENPEHSIGRAVRAVIWRISIFYLGSILVMVMALPWNDPRLVAAAGPFSAVLNLAHFPYIAGFMEGVIVLALLSAFNAQIYATSRMSASLSQRGDGFKCLGKLDKHGAPRNAVMLSVIISLFGVFLNSLPSGAKVLGFLLNAVGAGLLLVWIFIVISEIRLRPKLEREGKLIIKMWFFPYLSYVTLALLLALTVLMLTNAQARFQVIGSLCVVLVLLAIYALARLVERSKKKSVLQRK